MDQLPISYEDVVSAHDRISAVINRTPVFTSRYANSLTGAELFFKCENFQRVGAFKFRGAYNALSQLTPEQKASGVVTFSSGNHAQATALSANLLGMQAVIVMPKDAPAIKIAATRGYGGYVMLYDRYTENRDKIGLTIKEERNMTLIPPYDHPHVMAGQGTVAKELIEDVGKLDMVIIPVGGGGLISGCATVVKAILSDCAVIGVEPETGNDVQRSLRSGKIIHIEVPQTIADGAQTQHVGTYTFPVIQHLVDDILTVNDDNLIEAMRFFAGRMKIVVEPTGCLAAALVLGGTLDIRGKRVGVILSGGNVDLSRFASLING